MNNRYPQGDTPETLEGTAAHSVAWSMLAGNLPQVGSLTPEGIAVTDEMIEGGEILREVINQRIPANVYGYPNIETPVSISRIHPKCWGTPDVYAFSNSLLVLEIIDYKFGHKFVDEYENMQGIAYAVGVVDAVAKSRGMAYGALDQAVRLNFTIAQPRCYYRGKPVRTWQVRMSDVRAHINKLSTSAAEALGGNPRAVVNDACELCPGRHACPALQKAGYAAADHAQHVTPVELTPEAAALELRLLERASSRLGARIDGLKQTLLAQLQRGARQTWYGMEQSYGRQTWTIPPEQVKAIGVMYGKDLSKPAVITPKQAIAAGVDESVINAYSQTPKGALRLVPATPADAARVFGKRLEN